MVAVHVLTPDEQTLPGAGAAEYVDEETGQRVTVDHGRARAEVTRRVAGWRERVVREVRRAGGDYLHLSTVPALLRDLELFLRRREAWG
jgi:hypothetical protein